MFIFWCNQNTWSKNIDFSKQALLYPLLLFVKISIQHHFGDVNLYHQYNCYLPQKEKLYRVLTKSSLENPKAFRLQYYKNIKLVQSSFHYFHTQNHFFVQPSAYLYLHQECVRYGGKHFAKEVFQFSHIWLIKNFGKHFLQENKFLKITKMNSLVEVGK